MKISTEWLKEYVDHDLSPDELAERLTMTGLEVDDVIRLGGPLEGIVVGQIVAVREHPNADKNKLCDVDLGEGEPIQIVCGAPNVAAGQRVPVATVGATLHPSAPELDVLEITPRTIRGQTSHGMICSEMELGFSEDHSGIMVLNSDAEVGEPFARYLERQHVPADDTVLDIDLTPNRPDATSHLGVARDVAAVTGSSIIRPDVNLPKPGGEAAEQLTIEIQAPEACPRYVGMLVRDVTIEDSPPWLKHRLRAIGLRPRNNVVDITNFVMHECGQPLHAFDFDLIDDATIRVRLAEGDESFTTLDGEKRDVPEGTLFICDGARPVALAGIMGGENSEVSRATTNVLIESAYFDPTTIRKAAKALGLSTDSSYRFERGVDAGGQVWAAARAAALMQELAGGTIVPGHVDAHPLPLTPATIPLRLERVASILGVAISKAQAIEILTTLGFEVEDDGTVLLCTVPLFRPDVSREIDLIEEVARIYGYGRIPEPSHSRIPNRIPHPAPHQELRHAVRSWLAGTGYREIYTNSMLRREVAERFNAPVLGCAPQEGAVVETLNPISREMAALRPSLLPGMLEVMRFNRNHGQEALRFTEFGHVFRRADDERETIIPGYAEQEALLIGISGPVAPTDWDHPQRTADFFDLKGTVEQLLARLHVEDVTMTPTYEATTVTSFHLGLSASGRRLGVIAQVAGDIADDYDLDAPVYFVELDWGVLSDLATPHIRRRYEAISRYPVVDRDLAVVVHRNQPVGPMVHAIEEAGQPLLLQVGVFDLYEGENIASSKKSVAFSLRFGADRTLTDQEVDERINAILKRLESDYDAALRT